jgi:hypothetical protein
MHAASLWCAFEDLDLALQVSGLKATEGVLMRLLMARGHHLDKARKEMKSGR